MSYSVIANRRQPNLYKIGGVGGGGGVKNIDDYIGSAREEIAEKKWDGEKK